jgi:hypothetical protein
MRVTRRYAQVLALPGSQPVASQVVVEVRGLDGVPEHGEEATA